MGALHLAWRKFLWMGALYQELRIENHGMQPVEAAIGLRFAADFADIYEVRGLKRKARGQDLDTETTDRRGNSRLSRSRWDCPEHACCNSLLRPQSLSGDRAASRSRWRQNRRLCSMSPSDANGSRRARGSWSSIAREPKPGRNWILKSRSSARIETGNGQFDALVKRATSDLHMMTTVLPTGLYPYAGVPWFNTPFGRDGIITALECLWLNPCLAQGVLRYLASTQAVRCDSGAGRRAGQDPA